MCIIVIREGHVLRHGVPGFFPGFAPGGDAVGYFLRVHAWLRFAFRVHVGHAEGIVLLADLDHDAVMLRDRIHIPIRRQQVGALLCVVIRVFYGIKDVDRIGAIRDPVADFRLELGERKRVGPAVGKVSSQVVSVCVCVCEPDEGKLIRTGMRPGIVIGMAPL